MTQNKPELTVTQIEEAVNRYRVLLQNKPELCVTADGKILLPGDKAWHICFPDRDYSKCVGNKIDDPPEIIPADPMELDIAFGAGWYDDYIPINSLYYSKSEADKACIEDAEETAEYEETTIEEEKRLDFTMGEIVKKDDNYAHGAD